MCDAPVSRMSLADRVLFTCTVTTHKEPSRSRGAENTDAGVCWSRGGSGLVDRSGDGGGVESGCAGVVGWLVPKREQPRSCAGLSVITVVPAALVHRYIVA